MMRRVLMASVLALGLGVATQAWAGDSAKPGFVDANSDGVCDNAGKGGGCGMGQGQGCKGSGCAKFVDANSDGVCDNAGTGQGQGRGQCKGKGQGQGQGMGKGKGKGKGQCGGQGQGMGKGCKGTGFVDANGDGVCDTLQK